MEVEGNFHNLGIFYDRLSKMSRIVNVSNVKIVQSNVRDNAARTIRASYTATTFVYNDTAPDKPEDVAKTRRGLPRPKMKKIIMFLILTHLRRDVERVRPP